MSNFSKKKYTQESLSKSYLSAALYGISDTIVTFLLHYSITASINLCANKKAKQVHLAKSSIMYAISNIPKALFSYYDQKYIGATFSALLKYNYEDSLFSLATFIVKENGYVYLQEQSDNIENPYAKTGVKIIIPFSVEFFAPLPFDIYRSITTAPENSIKIINSKTTIHDQLNSILEKLRNIKKIPHLEEVSNKKYLQKAKHTNDLVKKLFDSNEALNAIKEKIENFLLSLNKQKLNKDELFEIIHSIKLYFNDLNCDQISMDVKSTADTLRKSADFSGKVFNEEINTRVGNFIIIMQSIKTNVIGSLNNIESLNKIFDYFSYYKANFLDYSTQSITRFLSLGANNLATKSLSMIDDIFSESFILNLGKDKITNECIKAIKNHDIKFLASAIKIYGKDITDQEYDNLLGKAVKARDIDIFKLLLAQGRDVSESSKFVLPNKILLSNDYEMMKLLIEYAQIDYSNHLRMSILYGNFNIIKLLVEKGATIEDAGELNHDSNIDWIIKFSDLALLIHSPIAVPLNDINNSIVKYAEVYFERNKENINFIEIFGKHKNIYDCINQIIDQYGNIQDNIINNYLYRYYIEFAEHQTILDEYIKNILPDEMKEIFMDKVMQSSPFILKEINSINNGWINSFNGLIDYFKDLTDYIC